MSEWSDQQLKDALRKDMQIRWKTRLQEHETSLSPARAQRRIPAWTWAAVVAALVAGSLWIFLPSPKTSGTELFATYFEPLPNALAPEVRGADQGTAIQQALRLYTAGRYEDALPLFDQVETSQQTGVYFLYRGITELALERGEAAQGSLEKATNESFRFSQQWYLSLSYLQQGHLDPARQILELIEAEEQHPFQQEASELLRELP